MKKILSVFLSTVLLLFASGFGAFAQEESEKIAIRFFSNTAGADYSQRDRLCSIQSDNVTFNPSERTDCIYVNDYVGNVYFEKMKPGRTYYVMYSFSAINGYSFPEKISEDDTDFICDKGCEVLWSVITRGFEPGINYLEVSTRVTVQGNFFQMIFGRIADIFYKIRAWSPY